MISSAIRWFWSSFCNSCNCCAVVADFLAEGTPFHRAGDGLAHGGNIKRLVEIIAGAEAQSQAERVHRFVSGEHDDFDARVHGLEMFEQFDAGHADHADVRDGDVNLVLLGQLDGAAAVVGHEQIVFILEDDAQRLPRPLLIIDDEKRAFLRRAGETRPV